jgi:diguanylate cyclase (GGDEF)-like protein
MSALPHESTRRSLARAHADAHAVLRDPSPQRMLGVCAVSWTVDATMLALLAGLAGADALGALAVVAGGGLLSCGAFTLAFARGWNRRLRDRFLTLPQLMVASAVALAAAAASPAVATPLATVLFIVFAFAALRLPWLQLLVAWAGITVGLAAVFASTGATVTVPSGTPAQAALSVVWVSLSLGRCALLGLYGAGLRRQLVQERRALADATGRLERLAMRDPLTGALNRRAIMGVLDAAIDEADPRVEPLAIALVDLDHFKAVNDRFGHPVGDDVLRRFVTIASRTVRLSDRIGRWGGEEFLVVLPGASGLEGARLVAERLREAVAGYPWQEFAPGLGVTVSVGVALAGPLTTSDALLHRADLALYRAMRAGRDRVCVDVGGAADETTAGEVGRSAGPAPLGPV